MDAGVESDGVLLNDDLLLDEGVGLLLEEVVLVLVGGLELEEVLLKVGDVFDDLLKNVIGGLSGVVLEGGTLTSQ